MGLANVNSPRGFSLFRSGGKAEPKRVRRNVVGGRAKDLMVGDAYQTDGAGGVIRALLSTDTILGIVEGIELNPISASPDGPVSQDYLPAGDAGSIIGIEDQDAEFMVQIATINTPDDLGKTVAIVDADGNQALRQSRQSVILDAAHKQFILMDLVQNTADNSEGAFAKVVVRLTTTEQQLP